jgi:hypothetical protein
MPIIGGAVEACQRHYSQKHTYTAATTCIDSAKISAEQQGRVVAVLSTNCRHCSSVHSRYCTPLLCCHRPLLPRGLTGFFRRPVSSVDRLFTTDGTSNVNVCVFPQNHRTLRFPPAQKRSGTKFGCRGKVPVHSLLQGRKKRDRKRVHNPKLATVTRGF